MAEPTVLVVGETPSLGRALVDLLEAAGIATQYASEFPGAAPGARASGTPNVVVIASNSPHCATAREWLNGRHRPSRLLVVGSRDPRVLGAQEIERVDLPLEPDPFLRLVRSLMDAGD